MFASFLTFCAQAGAWGETRHINNLYSKLLTRVSVDTAPHHTEGAPATHTSVRLVRESEQFFFRIKQRNTPRVSWNLETCTTTHTHTCQPGTDLQPFLRKHIIATPAHSCQGNYRVVVCSTAVKAKIKAFTADQCKDGLYCVVRLTFLAQWQSHDFWKISEQVIFVCLKCCLNFQYTLLQWSVLSVG